MHRLYKSFLLLFCIFLLLPLQGFCTHIVGGSLTYVYNGGVSYTVTLKLYRDCASGNAAYPATAAITVLQADGSAFSPSRDFTLATISTSSVTPVLPPCATSPTVTPCVEERIYQATVNLTAAPGGMHLYFQTCCRNATITNITSPGTIGESYYAFIPCYNIAWSENFALANGTTSDAGATAWTRTLSCTPPASAQVNNNQFEVTGANSSNTWLEDFTLANGTTSDAGATAWTRTLGATPPTSAQVNSNQFEITGANSASMTWTSQVIDISSCIAGVSLSAALSEASTLEATDNITISYSLNGGAPVTFPTNGSISDDFTSATASTGVLTGSTVQIFVTVQYDGASAGEIYRIDNVTVSGNAATTWASQSINISSYASGVNLSVDLSESGSLDASDNITVSYSLNGGALVTFPTNGSISDDFTSAYATATGLIGNTVQIFITVKYDAVSPASEIYRWDMVNVYDNTFLSNNNPVYDITPPLFFCQGVQDTIDYSATDANGDVLVYSLYTPYSDAAPTFSDNTPTFTPVTWVAGYSATSPLNSGGPSLSIDAATGAVSGVANSLGRYVLGVKCQEYRGGYYLGETTRGYEVSTVVCPPFVPSAPTAGTSNPSPICSGQTLSLTASTIVGATSYHWTGPNGFSSASQNPTISNATTAASGTYSVYASVSGCNGSVGTLSVTVNSTPATPSVGSNSTVCSGQTLSLTSNTVAGSTYSWTGPNSFSSTSEDPTISSVTTAAAGTYTLTRTSAIGCVSTATTIPVSVNQTPSAPTGGSNSAICSGQTLSLTASTTGTTYSWTGPNSFSSSSQNPTIAAATTAASGNYSFTATTSGCTSTAGTTSVTVKSNPVAPTAGSNSPVCTGQTLSLTASTIASATYAWTGPNSFSAASQNPTISSVTTAEAGNYTVTATVSGCTGPAGTTSITVNVTPVAPSTASNSPICTGQTLTIAASNIAGATYSWTGPNSFSAATQNTSVAAVTTAAAGNYSVTATVSGCTGPAGVEPVTVNVTPSTPVASSNSPVCEGQTLSLTSSTVTGATYSWAGPGSFSSALQNPTVAAVTTSYTGSYSVTAIVAGCGSSAATTAVTITQTPTTANAGSDQTSALCGLTSATLAANTPTIGTGNWSIVSGAGGSFVLASNPTTVFSGTAGTTYVLRWTISNAPCTSSTDDVTITFGVPPTTSNAGADQTGAATCGLTSITLAANTPGVGTGGWSIVSGAGGSFVLATNPTTVFSGTAGTTYVLRWTITNAPCTSTDDVTITLNQNPTTANAGPDQTSALCGLTSATLAGNTPTVGTGSWSIVSGAGGSFVLATNPTTVFNGTAGTTYVLRWTISNAPCTSSTDDVTITFGVNPTVAAAGPDQTGAATCGLTSVTLGANTPGVGTGSWSIVSGAGGSFVLATDPTTTFNGTAGTTYVLRWTISNAPCTPSTDDVTITFNQNPTTANAGPDQTSAICGLTSTTLAGNTPAVGTGSWSIVSGAGGSFVLASNPTTVFNGTAGTTYVLRWTISNAPCTPSADDVTITFGVPPTAAAAGPDQTGAATCGLTSVALAANTPGVGTGSWSIVSGAGGSFVLATNPTTVFSGTAGTTYVLRWTITNAPCTSTDDVTITFNQNPTVAAAGPDQTGAATCGLTSATLAANTPAVGTGSWNIVSGVGGSFVLASDPTTVFSGTAGNTYVLRWTISNAPCIPSTDDVTITFNQNPTVAAAGPDQTGAATCGSTSAILAANTPVVGTGSWSIVSGAGGSFLLASNPTTLFSGTAGTTYVLRWTISNAPCTSSTDDVTITFNQNPTVAAAGPDQTTNLCGLTSATLAANTPAVGTGSWSIVSGAGGSFVLASDPTTVFSGTAGTTYVLRWTISNAPCTPSTDDVTITFNINPTVAAAGPDQTGAATCGLTSATLAANTPGVGTGNWSIVSGAGGSFVLASNPTTVFSGTAGTTYVLRWTITNGPCTSTDDVTITFNQNPTVAAAGPDQTTALCGLTSAALAANTPTIGTGNWSIVSGAGGSFVLASNPTTVFNGTAGTTYVLRWTISNAPCTASSDDVTITFGVSPTVAAAGPDQTSAATCGLTSLTLAANTPGVGTGAWSIVSGAGGSFVDVTNPTTVFNGTAGTTYVLRWTITNAPCTSTDDVTVTLGQFPTAAAAGADQPICSSSATLAGNTPAIGTGLWIRISGSGSLTTPSSPTSGITGLAPGTSTYRWTTTNGACTTFDEVDIINGSVPAVNAGPDQSLCNVTTGTLAGNVPGVGTGAWSVIAGGGTVDFPAVNNSTVSTLSVGVNTFRWTITDGGCVSFDDINITIKAPPTVSISGPNQIDAATCGLSSVTLAANTPVVGTGSWSVFSGAGGSFALASDPNTVFSGTGGTTYFLRWTISNAPCAASTDDVTITLNQNPTIAAAGADQTGASTCGLTSVTLAANTPTVGTGNWSIISGAGGSFVLATDPATVFNGTAGTTYVLRWTVSNAPCSPSTDDVTITFNKNPTVAAAGPDQIITLCGLTSATLAANTPAIGTGSWSIVSGAGGSFVDATDPATVFSGTAGATYVLRWTISNAPCTPSTDDVTITFNQNPTVAAAGPDQIDAATCGLTSVTLAANTPAIGTGSWSIVSGAGGSFVLASNPTTVFSGTAGTTYVLRWTIANAPCTPSTDDVTITFNQNPTTANAGPDQTSAATCGLTSVTLAANTPAIGTGNWSIVSGAGGSFVLATDPATVFSGTAGTTYVLRWTIANALCSPSTDDVTITFNQNPTVAAAGPDQTSAICGLTSVTLAANTPAIGTGSWSIVSGAGGSFALASDPTTVFSGLSGTSYVLRWTISNAPCTPSTDDVTITFGVAPTPAAAGPDQTNASMCGLTSATLAANTPVVGTGSWSIVSGAGGSFVDATDPTTIFSGTTGTSYVLRWTITNAPCTSTDDVTITFNQNPTVAAAGPDQTDIATCGLTSVTLAANTPVVGTGGWSIVSGAGGSFVDATDPTTIFSGTAGTSYVLRWTITNAPCTSSDDVTITFNQNPTVAAAGPDQIDAATCGLTSVTLAANTPGVGTGSWSIVSGAGGSFVLATNPTTVFSGTAGTTYVLRWTISNAPCTPSSDDVTITFNQNPTVAAAGPDQPSSLTCGLTSATLAGNTPTIGTGSWSIVSGAGGSFALASDPTTVFSGTAGTIYVLRWTISNAPCTPSPDDVTITFGVIPSAPVAGSNTSICSGQILSLTASTVGGSTYTWSGPLSYSSALQNPTIVAVTTAHSGTYSVTATENGCTSPAGIISVTVNPTPSITASSNGPVCEGNTISLTATTITGANYSWSGPNGFSSTSQNPTIAAASTINSGTYTVNATSTLGCLSPNSVHTLTVTPTISVAAGADQTVCANNANVSLAGIISGGTATGIWASTGTGTFLPGASSLTAIYLPSSADTLTGTITFTLTSTNNGGCTAQNDFLTAVFTDAPTANAGPDQTVCANNAVVTLNGSVNSSASGGSWTSSGTGTFAPDNSTLGATYTPSAADTAAGVVTFTLTTTGVGLCSPVTDQMTLIITNAPRVNAGTNISVCSNNANAALNGSTTTGSGVWTTLGTGTFTPSAAVLTATFVPSAADIAAGHVDLILTSTSNGGCNSEDDTVTVIFTAPPVVTAGANQTVCANNNLVNITGTSTTGACQWTTSGTGTFANGTSLSTTYTPSALDNSNGSAVLTIASTNNGGCLVVTDQLTVTITPAPTANAGANQTVCANNAVVTLNGSFTVATGGSWSTNNGTGVFSSLTNMNATYTPSAADTVAGSVNIILTTTGNGLCTAVTSTMVVTISNAPSVNAGSTIFVCINNPNAALNGSSSTGSGTWTTLGGGSFSPNNTTLNASYVPSAGDISGGSVTLILTSSNNGTCSSEDDSVTVFFTPLPTVDAGNDLTVCANNSVVALSGTSSTGSGTWTTSGTGTFTPTASTLTASYIPSAADTTAGSVTLTLTTSNNGGCLPISDQMTITITDAPVANAGPDQTVCANNAVVSLSGSFTGATGAAWSSSGAGIFSGITNMSATYTPSAAEITAGTTTITLTTSGNGLCIPATDVMVITISGKPIVNAGINSVACKNNMNFPLNGTSSTSSGTWTTLGTGTFTPTATTLNATYIPSTADTTFGSVILILTSANNGNCLSEDDSITITYISKPIVNAGTDQTVCSNNALVSLSGTSNTSSGQWTTVGTGTFVSSSSLATNYTPGAADISAGSVKLVLASANNGTCNPVTDTVLISFSTSPTVDAGVNQTVCANNSVVTLNGSFTVSSGAGWTTHGSGTFSPDTMTMNATYTPSAADTAAGSVVLVLTTTGNGTCLSVTDNMTVTITDSPKANAGADQLVCLSNPVATLNGTSTTGNGTWSTMGTGTFTSTAALSTTYSASTADTTAGKVKLILTTANNGLCNAVTDTVLLTFVKTPVVNAGADQTVCANADTVFLSGTSTTGAGIWSSNGTGIFSPNATSLVPVYFASHADTASGIVVITFTSTGGCTPMADAMTITITNAPVVNAGVDKIICAGTQTVALSGTVGSGASTGIWSTSGTGTFTPANTNLNPVYHASSADSAAGNVTIYLRSTNNGNCNSVVDSMNLTIIQPPVVNAGPDQTLCALPVIQLNGSVIGGSGTGVWTPVGGGGTFTPNDSTLNAIYHPSASDTTFGGSLTLVLTSTNNGNCSPSRDTVVITFIPPPAADAWNDIVACKNNADSLKLKGLIRNAKGGKWSILKGSGSFVPADTSLNGYYVPDSAALTKDTIIIMLTTTGNGSCTPATDTMRVIFTPSPKVNAGADIPICFGDTSVKLSGSVTGGATTGHWTTLGSGTFVPNADALNATYFLSSGDTAAGSVTLVLASTNNGNCNSVFDTVKINIQAIPVVSVGSNITVCGNNANVILNGNVISSAGTGVWTSNGTGKFIPDSAALNATYIPSSADTAAGKVILILTATNACKPIAKSLTVTITNAPVANAGADISICEGNAVSLHGLINSAATGGHWTTSGNGTFSPNDITLNTSYILGSNDTGVVKITLTTTGNGQCLAVKDSMTITIGRKPVAEFTAPNGCVGQSIAFTDLSTVTGSNNSIVSWNWTIDNKKDTLQNPTHIYTSAGKDTVRLIVTTAMGCSDTILHVLDINPTPAASFTVLTNCSLDSVYFTSTSTIAGGNIVSWSWNLGDGSTSTSQNPVHYYNSSGSYTVSLTVTSDFGCTSIFSNTITPSKGIIAGLSYTADCNFNVLFADTSHTATGDSVISWSWNFGDGSALSTIKNPSHTYSDSGTYIVTLKIITLGGCSDTINKTIKLLPPPVADFDPKSGTYKAGTTVTFTDLSTNAATWLWTFGDGSSDVIQNPSHTYNQNGTLNVMLIVTNTTGCPDTAQYSFIFNTNIVVVPSAFTPNGDNVNDVLLVRGGPLREMDWRIYNEWGNEIFHATSQSEGWDGRYKGKIQPEGRYVFILKGTTFGDESIEFNGSVTILR